MGRPAWTVTTTKALSANAAQTILMVKPHANKGFAVLQWAVSFDGSVAGASIKVELVRASTDGTGAASPPTPRAVDKNVNTAVLGTILHNHSSEPTVSETLETHYLTPFGGMAIVQFPLGTEYTQIGGGDRFAIKVTTPTSVSPNCAASIKFEE